MAARECDQGERSSHGDATAIASVKVVATMPRRLGEMAEHGVRGANEGREGAGRAGRGRTGPMHRGAG